MGSSLGRSIKLISRTEQRLERSRDALQGNKTHRIQPSGDKNTDSAISKAEEGFTNMFISGLIGLEEDLSASQR